MSTLTETSVSTSVVVDTSVEQAFQVFTEKIGTWWDADKHILRAELASMEFQPWVGGHIVDHGVDGSTCRWATILAYQPPARVRFSWNINTGWELEPDPARCSEVDITFTAVGPRRTHVVLIHRHLDRHGEGWEQMRDAVASGWSLTGFAEAVSRAETAHGQVQLLGRAVPTLSDEEMNRRRAAVKPFTAVLLRTTSTFVRPDVDPIVWEHGRRNFALMDAGLAAIILPATDDSDWAGLAVFTVGPDEVHAIMDGDPGVAAGIFSYEAHPVRGFPGAALPG
ncbi:MAG TPA: SRPBCC family protein [Pseudonocardia sp.]